MLVSKAFYNMELDRNEACNSFESFSRRCSECTQDPNGSSFPSIFKGYKRGALL